MGTLHSFANAECGDLLLSLCYVTRDQTLTVAIMKGVNMTEHLLSSVGQLLCFKFQSRCFNVSIVELTFRLFCLVCLKL